ncbi:SDR family NAD(P)-dependent oxidoreductase [Rhizobium alvei]|uniref:SDR family NAD(P)-dependent oxidoreductase n=1 Tax=Rhizobium alvei TaxID=1132659 RepID=A0ABT8YH36_9HYPH|nr:SDR family NAD(P)-dependent oxidoreductase [Rhizobium alvei]MDO6962990.1 SDR family NAD(P)-dependent oxidoreductase [Rhizobium alvei]
MSGTHSGTTVLVTGASGGFGAASARRFYAEGANLVLSDLNEEALAALAGEFSADRVATLAGRIEDEVLSEALVKLALDRFGRLDIAFNNAGIAYRPTKLAEIDSDEARLVIAVNTLGVFYAMKAQLPVMEAQFRAGGKGGVIINMASVAGVVGAPGGSIYAASKHAVVGLTRSASIEYARRGIRINAICPSFARTAMVQNILDDGDDNATDLVRGIPMRRLAEVEEVVTAVMFAANPANSFMTGQTLHVDGGLTAF